MSLLAIKKHMLAVKVATLHSLCQLFKADADMMRCLLRHWIHKGMIRQCQKTPACGTRCAKCPSAEIEMYEWMGQY